MASSFRLTNFAKSLHSRVFWRRVQPAHRTTRARGAKRSNVTAALFSTLGAALLLGPLACEKEPPAPPERPRALPIRSAAAPSAREAAAPPALSAVQPRGSERTLLPQVSSAIVEIRRHLSLAAPAPTFRHLAFGAGFLVQLRDASVRLLKSANGTLIAEVPLATPLTAVGLPAGSVLVCGRDQCDRFDPGQQKPHRLGRISLLPDAILEPNRGTQDRVWVIEPALAHALRYSLLDASPEPGAELESTRDLLEYDHGAITTLADGALLYTAARSLVRVLGATRTKSSLPDEVARVWRLEGAERADRVWALNTKGEAFLLELAGQTRIVRRFATSGEPFDFAATKSGIALVSIQQGSGEGRTFVLNVYSATGMQIKSYVLGKVGESADSDWAAVASRDREVIVAEHPPRIAVGGRSALRLFDLSSGDEIVVP